MVIQWLVRLQGSSFAGMGPALRAMLRSWGAHDGLEGGAQHPTCSFIGTLANLPLSSSQDWFCDTAPGGIPKPAITEAQQGRCVLGALRVK